MSKAATVERDPFQPTQEIIQADPQPEQALALLQDSPIAHFAVVRPDFTEQMEAIEENLAGGGFTPYQFDRIKVPAGGSTTWEVPTPEGETEPVKELEVVICLQRAVTKSYWPEGIEEGGNKPPTCFSMDGLMGVGDPGIACGKCSHNEWGTGKNGAKACPDRRMLFLLRQGSILPVLLLIPGGSAKNLDRYIRTTLSGMGCPYYGALTKLKLRAETNPQGIKYSQIVPQYAGRLPRPHALAVKAYGLSLNQAMLQNTLPAAGGDLD